MLKMVDGTGIIGVDMVCPLGVSTPQSPNYDRVELEGTGMLVLPNSLDAPLEGLELGGKTEQVTTTGKNLFDIATCPLEHDGVSFKIPKSSGNVVLMGDFEENTQYTLSVQKITSENANSAVLKFDYTDGTRNEIKIKDLSKKSLTSDSAKNVKQFVLINPFGGVHEVSGLQLEKGTTATPYEPYTGGKPSPSQEYQQEIKNSGKWNEEKQKYEVDVKITGKNLFDREKAKDNSNWIIKSNDGYAKFPIYVKKGNKITFSYTEKLTTGKKFLGISLSDAGSTVAWLYHDTTASLINNKYTIAATNDYIYLMCSKSDIQNFVDTIQTLQVEISPTQTDYQPYAEQFLTLTSDRPLTKWDKLVEQGGQIGWLYKSAVVKNFNGDGYKIQSAGNIGNVNKYIIVFPDALIKGKASADIYVDRYRGIIASYAKEEYGICCNWNDGIKYFNAPNETVKTVDDFKKWLTENPLTIAYETETTEFVPLPQSEQNAIRALKTYYPTTVITVDGGELDPDIKVTYRKEK